MLIDQFPLSESIVTDKLVKDYLIQNPLIAEFSNGFATKIDFRATITNCAAKTIDRKLLVEVLSEQYNGLAISAKSNENIQALLSSNTFTVTTGHQLCLLTGPAYFIYKIISALALCRELSGQFKEKRFVPVYWMATEDHDSEEINHFWINGKKHQWTTTQLGAVGEFSTEGIIELLNEVPEFSKGDSTAQYINNIIKEAYQKNDLASATRYLVNALFGHLGLVVIDANETRLKKIFLPQLKKELLDSSGEKYVGSTNAKLEALGYKVQVHPRAINLFYKTKNRRSRIEKISREQWKVLDSEIVWNQDQLVKELEEFPEKFSPNVIVRPLYQEAILPNIAYIGGPGELAYWLQLKSLFEAEGISFPQLVLRDSFLFLSEKSKTKLAKLGLKPEAIFKDRNELTRSIVNANQVALENEKVQLTDLFRKLELRAKDIDPTLTGSVQSELQKSLNSLDVLEKKMVKALKIKDENKINQLSRILEECFPEGTLQERRDNFFQFQLSSSANLIDQLINIANPSDKTIKIVALSSQDTIAE
jgi:bacillithiol synthase